MALDLIETFLSWPMSIRFAACLTLFFAYYFTGILLTISILNPTEARDGIGVILSLAWVFWVPFWLIVWAARKSWPSVRIASKSFGVWLVNVNLKWFWNVLRNLHRVRIVLAPKEVK